MKFIDNLVNEIRYRLLKFELRNEEGLKEYEKRGKQEKYLKMVKEANPNSLIAKERELQQLLKKEKQ